MAPQLSIAIPTFNRLPLLQRALASALGQLSALGAAVEVLVLDNGSSDGSRDWLKRLPARRGLRVQLNRRNLGMVGNWNAALGLARGRWLTLLHDDDALLPGFGAAVLDAHAKRPELGFSFGAFEVLREGRRPGPRVRPLGAGERLLPPALAWSWIFHEFCPVTAATVAMDRARLQRAGGFRDVAGLAADGDAYLRLAAAHPVLYRSGVHARFGFHGGNLQLGMNDGATVASLRRLALGQPLPAGAFKAAGSAAKRRRRLADWLAARQEALNGLGALTQGREQAEQALRRAGEWPAAAAPRTLTSLRRLLALPLPMAAGLWRLRQALSRRWGVFVAGPEACRQRLQAVLEPGS